MPSERIPVVVSTGAVDMLGQRIVVHVTDEGQRVIDKDSLMDYLALTARCDEPQLKRLREFMHGRGVPDGAIPARDPEGGRQP